MPIIKSAKKAARQAEKRRSNNQQIKKTIRSALKDFHAKPSAEKLAIVQSEYDKAVKKGLLKKNTASRRKAKLAAFAKANDMKLVASKKVAPKAEKAVIAEKPAAKTAAKKATAKKPTAKKTTTKKAEK